MVFIAYLLQDLKDLHSTFWHRYLQESKLQQGFKVGPDKPEGLHILGEFNTRMLPVKYWMLHKSGCAYKRWPKQFEVSDGLNYIYQQRRWKKKKGCYVEIALKSCKHANC